MDRQYPHFMFNKLIIINYLKLHKFFCVYFPINKGLCNSKNAWNMYSVLKKVPFHSKLIFIINRGHPETLQNIFWLIFITISKFLWTSLLAIIPKFLGKFILHNDCSNSMVAPNNNERALPCEVITVHAYSHFLKRPFHQWREL